jgi:hypothetical protein
MRTMYAYASLYMCICIHTYTATTYKLTFLEGADPCNRTTFGSILQALPGPLHPPTYKYVVCLCMSTCIHVYVYVHMCVCVHDIWMYSSGSPQSPAHTHALCRTCTCTGLHKKKQTENSNKSGMQTHTQPKHQQKMYRHADRHKVTCKEDANCAALL